MERKRTEFDQLDETRANSRLVFRADHRSPLVLSAILETVVRESLWTSIRAGKAPWDQSFGSNNALRG